MYQLAYNILYINQFVTLSNKHSNRSTLVNRSVY